MNKPWELTVEEILELSKVYVDDDYEWARQCAQAALKKLVKYLEEHMFPVTFTRKKLVGRAIAEDVWQELKKGVGL